jgi:hypothetical protein
MLGYHYLLCHGVICDCAAAAAVAVAVPVAVAVQLPTFNELSMVSLLGAVMSVAYCVIAVVSGNIDTW